MRSVGFFLAFVGVIVLVGWSLGIAVLKSIVPNAVTMKVETAISFILTGAMMSFFESKEDSGRIFGMSAALALTLFTMTNAFYGYAHGATIAGGSDTAVATIAPGLNSLATIVCFIVIGASGVAAILGHSSKYIRWAGLVCLASGLIAIVGHAIGSEPLYFYIDNISTGMAIHTAVLFAICGAALTRVR